MEKTETIICLEAAIKNVSTVLAEMYSDFTIDEVYTLIQINRKMQKILHDKNQQKLNL